MSSNPTLSTAAFKLSSQQERAWRQHEAGVSAFAQCVIAIDGDVNVDRLKSTLRQLIAKYEILRTVFRRQTGVKLPFQVIQETPELRFEQVSGNDIDGILSRERESGWDLENGPSVRALLISTSAGTRLALTLPAFCADASTLKSFSLELAAGYGGETADAGEIVQYADLVEWQNEMLASDETKPGREFWRDLCRNTDFAALNLVTLPLEKQSHEFSPQFITREASKLRQQLEGFGSRLNVSTEDVLLAAWNVLLFRLSGQENVIGCEFNGRRYEELATALGPLARTLPLKTEIQHSLMFEKLLGQVKSIATEARNWQESFSWNQAAGDEHVLPFSLSYQDLGAKQSFDGVGFTLERVHVVSERYKLRLIAVRRE